MININRHQRRVNGESKTPTFWHQIENDLQSWVGKSVAYKVAFAQLILKKDREIWNGTNTIEDVTPEQFSLPTEAEIAAEEERNKKKKPASEDEAEDSA